MAETKKAEGTAQNEPNMVKVRLHLGDRAETKAPLKVWINGVQYVIPRGVETEVPDFVEACIRDSENAKMEEMEYNAAHENVHYHY